MGRKPRPLPKLLTETELEMMQVLWRRGGATAADVVSDLSATKKLAYTSVSTILRVLEQKQFVKSEKAGRGHQYTPLISKKEYEGRSLDDLVTRVFDAEPVGVVQRLLETKSISKDDLDEIRKMLDEAEGK